MASTVKYKIKDEYSSKERLITLYKGKKINLSGEDVKCTIRETTKSPKKVITVEGAKESVLKDLLENPKKYGNWSHMIEKVEIKKES